MKHTSIPPMDQHKDARFVGDTAHRYACSGNTAIVGIYDSNGTIYLACGKRDTESIGTRLAREDAIRYCATIMQRMGVRTITVDPPPTGTPVAYEEG